MTVTLNPKTRKGKNVIANNGNVWDVLRISDVPPSNWGSLGPFALIQTERDKRWVSLTDDINFEVVLND